MKMKKKVVIFGMSLLVVAGAMTGIFASYVSGTEYQYVIMADIPGGGREKYNLTLGSKKATTGVFATFTKTYGEAWLGNFAELVTSSKDLRSDQVGMPLNNPALATERGCSKGSVYYMGVASSAVEPSNTCDVKVKFSADNLK